MCTGKCSKVIAVSLYVLAAVSIICNIMLFFPDFSTEWVGEDTEEKPRLTPEIKFMGGLVGGGLMILIPAIHIHLTSSRDGCCANRCGMFLSIGFAAVGVAGAIYSMAVAGVGLANGPVCNTGSKDSPFWNRPFNNANGSYLENTDWWKVCVEPEDVVAFNVGLFSTLLVTGGIACVLCGIQMVNGLFGCICGTCGKE